jgi:HPt (histidine-containing phosphotransfer) domain-containing protein
VTQLLGQHFVREASEYLGELERLVRGPGAPDAGRLFHLVRAVRGSASLARADDVARIAERVDLATRALVAGGVPWTAELRERLALTVADLQALVGGPGGPVAEERARAALSRWAERGPLSSPAPTASTDAGDGLLGFLRAELAAALEALDRSIARLRSEPRDEAALRDALDGVRVLRGLSGTESFGPVMAVVDAVDEVVRATIVEAAPAEGERLDFLIAARDLLAASLRSIERGDPPPLDGATFDRFRELHVRSMGDGVDESDPTVVPISALFYDDAGPHVLSASAAPAPSARPTPPGTSSVGQDGGGDAVPIETLLLRGERALDAALRVRTEVDRLLTRRDDAGELRALLDEVWELVELGRSPDGA